VVPKRLKLQIYTASHSKRSKFIISFFGPVASVQCPLQYEANFCDTSGLMICVLEVPGSTQFGTDGTVFLSPTRFQHSTLHRSHCSLQIPKIHYSLSVVR